uniref:Uncharacterized protein n=1 Tax=Ditylenchus dipsaci TaxID=166011 RepID=A0A915ENQ6_9BILA
FSNEIPLLSVENMECILEEPFARQGRKYTRRASNININDGEGMDDNELAFHRLPKAILPREFEEPWKSLRSEEKEIVEAKEKVQ